MEKPAGEEAFTFPASEGRHPVFRGDKFFGSDGDFKSEGTFKLDTTNKPKTIKFMQDGKEDHTLFGIYYLDRDRLIICGIADGKEPPKEFKTAKGSPAEMYTLKREKK